jgi:3-hydroxybutyryl-CoA dehydrogenase
MATTGIESVAVLGCGLMGAGIAEVCAAAGYTVRVREVSEEALEKGLAKVEQSLARAVEKGKRSAQERDEITSRIHGTLEMRELAGCGAVIEAVVENLPAKRAVLQEADSTCSSAAFLASNTSSLSITELAAGTTRPERFIGLHFFNPVPVMRLVEVVRSPLTSVATFDRAGAFAESLGKTAIRTGDTSGFVVNRLLVPFLLDAVRVLEEGVASTRDIDEGMRLGCAHPMGPLTLLDFVGLDTTYAIANILYEDFREKRFAPPPLLKRMVQAGLLGRKSGRGFYDYRQEPPVPLPGLV